MKTKINIKKKRSFAKILRLYLYDNRETIILVLVISFSIVFIGYPFVFKQIPDKYALINLVIECVVAFIILPLVNFIISVTNSLKGMQYIPLNENEINSIHCDNIYRYVDYINELITYDNVLFSDYRAVVPTKIMSEVIEFGNTYYSSGNKIDYSYHLKKFVVRD